MKVFVAGGSGTIGIPLVRVLLAAGHQVTALTRSSKKQDELRALGASVAIADALDRDALESAVQAAHPTCVIHELTALPKGGPRRRRDLEATNLLRTQGTRNLLEAAIHAGAQRVVVGSFAMLAPRDHAPVSHDDAAAAVASMERQVLDAVEQGSIEGVILRYGMFYGLEVPSTVAMMDMVRRGRLPLVRGDNSLLPLVHVEDAARATLCAVDRGRSGATYDIVDDHPVSLTDIVLKIARHTGAARPIRVPAWLPRVVAPYMARMISTRMPLTNAQAKAELGWRPTFPSVEAGLTQMFHRAA